MMIEQRLGRQLAAGVVSTGDIVAMSTAGVDDELIVNHIRAHGVAAPPSAEQVIALHQQGVSTQVIKTMQEPPRVAQTPVLAQPVPVIVEEHHYGPPLWGPPSYRPRHWRHRPQNPNVSWGVSVSN